MLMKPDSSIISSPVRHWHKKVILAMVEQDHCSARIQCRWHREITTTGDWQVQQTRLLQKSKKTLHQIHTKFQFMDDFSHFWGVSCATELPKKYLALNWPMCCIRKRYHCSKKYWSYIFPPNCTSHLQPMDMGIIHHFKCQYRTQLICKTVTISTENYLVMHPKRRSTSSQLFTSSEKPADR